MKTPEEAAHKYSYSPESYLDCCHVCNDCTKVHFLAGVKWRDENPKPITISWYDPGVDLGGAITYRTAKQISTKKE